jgi:hypothetical protein
MNKGTKGALLASAVATLFIATAAMAQDSGAMSASGAQAQGAKVKCVGANSCKGQGACKSAQNDCKGENACKGKGFVNTATPDECTQKGGHTES